MRENEIKLSRRQALKRIVVGTAKVAGVTAAGAAIGGLVSAASRSVAEARPAAAPIPTPVHPEKRLIVPLLTDMASVASEPADSSITFEQLNRITSPPVELVTHTGTPGNSGVTYTVESRKAPGNFYTFDLDDASKAELASVTAGYARSKNYTIAEAITSTEDQRPAGITMVPLTVNIAPIGAPVDKKMIGNIGGLVENGKLFVIFEPINDLNQYFGNPDAMSNINFTLTSRFLSAVYSGGSVSTATDGLSDIQNLKDKRAIKIL